MPARRTKRHKTSSTPRSRAKAKKDAPVEHELPGGFWRQIIAILMVAMALFFVITWFGHGGSVVNQIHATILKGLGIATYAIPALLVYLSVRIFKSENNRVAVPVYIASILMVLWISGIGAIWNHGGLVGGWLNTIMTKALDQGFVIFIYIILVFITTAFILQLSPVTFFKGTKNLVKTNKKVEQPAEENGKKLGQLEIKVNSSLSPSQDQPKKPKGLFIHKTKEEPVKEAPTKAVEKPAEEKALVAINDPDWKKATDPLTFAVGKDISGHAVVANLAKMPHLLIAGTTGSGKSVMTNTLITSLLYRNAPSDVKLIIVDPKQVEMAQYQDIPHLLTPIITSTDKALSAMKWAVGEMERRYTLMAEEKVKNIADYNTKMAKLADENAEVKNGKMPYIVIIIDEMADLMMMAGKDLEMLIVRIAQKGRAAGIHLVLATQRPEVKVITGLIKANIPGRIAFAVGSQMDSRIMLDQGGAEKLLGKGDMLLLTTEMMGKPRRIQGAWASDDDINKVTDFLRAQRPPEYNDEVVAQQVAIKGMTGEVGGMDGLGRRYDPNDPIVRKTVEISLSKGKFSTAMLQTYLGKGHGFVSGLAIWFEEIGVIGPQNGNKPRDLLIQSMDEFDQLANA